MEIDLVTHKSLTEISLQRKEKDNKLKEKLKVKYVRRIKGKKHLEINAEKRTVYKKMVRMKMRQNQ